MSRVYTGKVIAVEVDDVVLPNGHPASLERIIHPGGAAIIALNESNEVCLLSQYRHIAKGRIIELPAGKLEHGNPLITAKTELLEEAGVSALKWQSLGWMYSSPGVFSEVIHFYLATELNVSANAPEAIEDIEVMWWPIDKAVAAARSGELLDAKTIIGLIRAEAALKQH